MCSVVGLYMAILTVVTNIFVYFFVHNLSKEYDIKAHSTLSQGHEDLPEETEDNENKLPFDMLLQDEKEEHQIQDQPGVS